MALTCIPSSAKIRIKRKRRRRREMMDFMLANRDTTRFRRLDQYLTRRMDIMEWHADCLYDSGAN